MKKPELNDFGISQEDIDTEAENQTKRNKGPGCIALPIGGVLWILSTLLFALLMEILHIFGLLRSLLLIIWSVGSFLLVYRIIHWCHNTFLREKVPATIPSIHEYNNALAEYGYWLHDEEKKEKEYWFGLSGHRFEEEFGIVLMNNGYSIIVTKRSADGGVDIIAQKGRVKKIIQCKAHKNAIGPDPIRELFGVLKSGDFKAKSAVVVCLAGFTKGAQEFAGNNNIELWDIADVLRLAKRPAATD